MKPINKFEILSIAVAFLTVTFAIQGALQPATLNDLMDGKIHKVLSQKDGRILISGDFSQTKLIRINADKSIDTQFNDVLSQAQFNRAVHSLALLEDQSIISVGEFSNFDQSIVGYIAKLKPNGELDHEFTRNSGVGFDDIVYDVTVQPDGRIIVVGEFTSYNGDPAHHIARLHPDGQLDKSFEVNEGFDASPRKAKLSRNGQELFVTGPFNSYQNAKSPYLARIHVADGSLHSFK